MHSDVAALFVRCSSDDFLLLLRVVGPRFLFLEGGAASAGSESSASGVLLRRRNLCKFKRNGAHMHAYQSANEIILVW